MKKKLLVLALLVLFILPVNVFAKSKTVDMYLFHGEECPHCNAEIKYINKLLKDKKYKNVKFHKYEVWHDEANEKKYFEVQNILKLKTSAIPFLIIGSNYIIGYNSETDSTIKATLDYYLEKEYQDPVGDYLLKKDTKDNKYYHYDSEGDVYKVPLLGEINAKGVSLLLISIVIGLVDGFNPCAMWILLFLLSLLISTKDRKKMWILGLTFILTSGFVYLLFMLSWLNVAKHTSQILFIRNLIGIFALAFGLVNLYRYIKSVKTKDVGCDVTDATKKRKIMDRIRTILDKNKLVLAVLGIMLLAISVNLIELLCSLGLPVMYSEILGLNELSHVEYAFYIFIYMLCFLIDDLIIFAIAMKTLKLKGISNKYMKYSHLIGGLIMLVIGLLMLFKPAWLLFNFS
ncbi:MAG: hypothetical protein K6G37_00490 [Bacilli bacterium]|nr:hypothetical protein [Bacilli bacterium]